MAFNSEEEARKWVNGTDPVVLLNNWTEPRVISKMEQVMSASPRDWPGFQFSYKEFLD